MAAGLQYSANYTQGHVSPPYLHLGHKYPLQFWIQCTKHRPQELSGHCGSRGSTCSSGHFYLQGRWPHLDCQLKSHVSSYKLGAPLLLHGKDKYLQQQPTPCATRVLSLLVQVIITEVTCRQCVWDPAENYWNEAIFLVSQSISGSFSHCPKKS